MVRALIGAAAYPARVDVVTAERSCNAAAALRKPTVDCTQESEMCKLSDIYGHI